MKDLKVVQYIVRNSEIGLIIWNEVVDINKLCDEKPFWDELNILRDPEQYELEEFEADSKEVLMSSQELDNLLIN